MKKKNLLEYYEGDPDSIYDTEKYVTWHWNDKKTTCFGYFPTSLDNDYELLSGHLMHRQLAEQAAEKLIGKAMVKLTEMYESYVNWIVNQCYDKAYCLGRYWEFNNPKYPNIMSFWDIPSSKMVKEIVNKLGIDPSKFVLVTEISQKDYEKNITVLEYIESNSNGEDDGEKEIQRPFKIDPKVDKIIRSYNKPNETWQSMKEKEGWKSLAQRNATLYQENRQRVDEYFQGNPDTVNQYDDEDDDFVTSHNYRDPRVISFGYFQTSLDGGKEFMYDDKLCHWDISKNLANNILGKALYSEYVDEDVVRAVQDAVYYTAAFKGRVFLTPRVVTTWYTVSSEELADLLNKIGGVDKYLDFIYVISGNDGRLNVTVREYINSNKPSNPRNETWMNYDIKDSPSMSEKLVEFIRQCNAPNSALEKKSSKLGRMTIAQYNSLIRQEEKNPKNTIKEEDMNKDKYQKEFSNYISIMNEALKKNDFAAYNAAKEMLEETIEDSKEEKALLKEMETNNFGILNHIFENELPTLFKSNKKAVREVIKTIKEDKNLLGQFNFYRIIKEQYKGEAATKYKANELLEKLVKIVAEDVDASTIKASNKKLRKVMIENGIVPTKFVDNDSKALYESGNIILTKKKSTANMMPLIESYDAVCQYMENHKNDKVNKAKDIDTIIEEFENKLKDTLTESEISFVQQITDFRSPIAEQRKEKLFNKFKNECIDKINEMLKEDSENIELKSLNSQIEEMKYNKESIVKDIAKLLEIRDILMDD